MALGTHMNLKPWTKEFWFQEVWKKKEEKAEERTCEFVRSNEIPLHELTRSLEGEVNHDFVSVGIALHEARIANIKSALSKGHVKGRRELLLEINVRMKALERIKEKYLDGQYS